RAAERNHGETPGPNPSGDAEQGIRLGTGWPYLRRRLLGLDAAQAHHPHVVLEGVEGQAQLTELRGGQAAERLLQVGPVDVGRHAEHPPDLLLGVDDGREGAQLQPRGLTHRSSLSSLVARTLLAFSVRSRPAAASPPYPLPRRQPPRGIAPAPIFPGTWSVP